MKRSILTLLACLCLLLTGILKAVPTDDELGDLAKPLSKKIKVQFLDTPLRRVAEQLQHETGLTFVVERDALKDKLDAPVSLEAGEMSIRDVLDWTARVTGTDWEVSKGIVVITTQEAIGGRTTETRVYDIKALVKPIPNFVSPTLDINSSLSNTNSGGSEGRMGEDVKNTGGSSGLFGDVETRTEGKSRSEQIEDITNLIQDTVGRQEDWAAFGGTRSSLREMNGNLIVKTTPREHAAIQKLIADLSAGLSRMVSVEARFVLVKSSIVDEMMAKADHSLILDAKDTDAFLKRLNDAGADAKPLATTRTACYNGQRVYLASANEMTFLSDLVPIPDAETVDPTLSTARNGVVLDVEPTIGADGKTIAIVFRSDVVTGMEMRRTPIPVGTSGRGIGFAQSSHLNADLTGTATTQPGEADLAARLSGTSSTTQPADRRARIDGRVDGDVAMKGELLAPSAAQLEFGTLEMPAQDMVRYRSAIQIPNGGAVVLSGVSRLLKSTEGKDAEVVMILRAQASK